MKYLTLLLLLPSLVLAHDVILRVNGKTVHTVRTDTTVLTITDQRMLIDVRTGSTPPPPPVTPPTPTPTPVTPPPADPSPSACGPRARNVTVVNTGSMTNRYNKRTYAPKPTTIVAFAFTTPATGNYRGRATSTVTTVSPQAKLLSISECPGDYKNPIQRSNACVQTGIEVAQVVFTTNPNADPRFECVLEKGRTYYINASSHAHFNREDLSCSNTRECSYSFMRDPS